MSVPVQLYTSAGLPVGPRAKIQFYRPPTTTDALGSTVAQVVAFGSESSGTAVGSLVVTEDVTMDFSGQEFSQKGTYMEDLSNPTIVLGKPSLSITGLISSGGQPTVLPGDYCSINVGLQIGSTGASPSLIPASRWVVLSDGITTNGVNKMSLKLILDRPNSSPSLSQF